MNQAIVRGSTVGIAIIAALILGRLVGEGNLAIPILMSLLLAYWMLSRWLAIPLEVGVAAFLILGYLIGNRGFAQLSPTAGLPLLMGELGLASTIGLLILRIPIKKELPFSLNTLGLVIFIWIALSALHLVTDLREWRFYAIRDFAIVYYAFFFFVGQFIATHAKATRVMLITLGLAFIGMGIIFPIYRLNSSFFLDNIQLRGTPIIFYKADLVGVYGCAMVLFFFYYYIKKKNAFLLIPAVVGLGLMFFTLSRAAMVGLALACVMLIYIRLKSFLLFIFLSAIAGSLALFTYYKVNEVPLVETKLYGFYEHAVSMVDFHGTGTYSSPSSKDTGDNTRFRTVWWQTMLEKTLEEKPLFGFGFGYNLSNPFIERYYATASPDSTSHTRSPHNYALTIFARTGIFGFSIFLLLLTLWAQQTLKLLHETRRTKVYSYPLILQIICWAIFVAACFQVILEGPMGAVPFWLMLGLSQGTKELAETQQEEATDTGETENSPL